MRRLSVVLLASIVGLLGTLPAVHEGAQASSHPPPVRIAYEGMSFPAPIGGAFESFSPADVNNAGQVVFYAKSTAGGCGLFLGDGVSLTMLAWDGALSVDGPISLCPGGALPTRPPLTNSGALTAFEATIAGLVGLYLNVGIAPAPPYPKVARTGDPAPVSVGGTFGMMAGPSDVADFGGGQVLFRSPIAGGCAAEALFVKTSPTTTLTVARASGGCADSAPTGGPYVSLPAAVMNNSGRVVFHATAPVGDEIDYSNPTYTSRSKVVADGDSWGGDPTYGTTLDVMGDPLVNDLGQVAFRASGGAVYGEGYYRAPSTDPVGEDGAGAGTCTDGLDNGGDTLADANDGDCVQEDSMGAGTCRDGIDNGGDTFADGSDPDCVIAIQSQVGGVVVAKDASVLGGLFIPCPGEISPFSAGPNRHRLPGSGQIIDRLCGSDPVGILALPSFDRVVKDSEPMPSPPFSVSDTFSDLGEPAVSENGSVAFGATGTAGCAPSSAPCTGVFRSDFGTADKDSDGDGLLDGWESSGMDVNGDGTIDLNLPALGANPNHKDVFVEIDYMDCAVGGGDCAAPPPKCTVGGAAIPAGHKHKPTAAQEIADVVSAFASASVNNPDASTGISLHVLVDEGVKHSCFTTWNPVQPSPCKPAPPAGSFEWYKCNYFMTSAERGSGNAANIKAAKQQVYHYSLWNHQGSPLSCVSGSGEIWGNDFYVALGGLRDLNGNNLADSNDTACWGIDPAATEDGAGAGSCSDGVDNGGGDEDGDAVAEIDGADSDCPSQGTRNERSGTFMHELGHNLALCHGGPLPPGATRCEDDATGQVSMNYKPNYLSVMSYTFQMDHTVARGTTGVAASGSFLDYSRWALPPGVAACPPVNNLANALDERPPPAGAGLDEAEGIDCNAPPAVPAGLNDWVTAYTAPTNTMGSPAPDLCLFYTAAAVGDIDWDKSGAITGPSNGNGGPIGSPINDPYGGPPTEPPPCLSDMSSLQGFVDWTAIRYDFRQSRANYSDGLPHSPLVPEDTDKPYADDDSDGIVNLQDNCRVRANPGQEDSDSDDVGNRCDNCPSWPNPSQAQPPWAGPPGDADCDGWSGANEGTLGTEPDLACSLTGAVMNPGDPSKVNDEPVDNWPADMNDDQVVNLGDINFLAPPMFFSVGPGLPYEIRYDLNLDNVINLADINYLAPPMFFATCTP